MKVNPRELSRRMRAGRSADSTTLAGETTRAELVTTVRRLGYIALRIHEVVMGQLTRTERYELAEQFNDLFKPLADLLAHFELEESNKEKDDEKLP